MPITAGRHLGISEPYQFLDTEHWCQYSFEVAPCAIASKQSTRVTIELNHYAMRWPNTLSMRLDPYQAEERGTRDMERLPGCLASEKFTAVCQPMHCLYYTALVRIYMSWVLHISGNENKISFCLNCWLVGTKSGAVHTSSL